MDCQCTHQNRCTLADGWQLDNSCYDHMFLDRGLCIWHWDMLGWMDNRNLKYILVCILRRGCQYRLVHRNRILLHFVLHRQRLIRKVMESRGMLFQELWLLQITKFLTINFKPSTIQLNFKRQLWNLLCLRLHCTNGSPVYPAMQAQIGVWLTTLQSALTPHESMQGSWHFWLIQANRLGHSLLAIHWGLQFGGLPMNSFKQEQDGVLLITWHCEFGPQGLGWQGFTGTGVSSKRMKFRHKMVQEIYLNFNCELVANFLRIIG